MTADEVLRFLRAVRSLRFEARSDAGTGWDGIGIGWVAVTEPTEGILLFNESGTWTATTGRESTFTNVFRWSLLGDSLRLEHLRHGPARPVVLFDMAPDDTGNLRDVSPHHCRQDCYSATLVVVENCIHLAWSILGPRKRESIRYVYS